MTLRQPSQSDRVTVGVGINSFSFHAGLLLLVFALASRSLAHDPHEITSTIRMETNRTLVEIEMEFSAAMALVGVPRSGERVKEAALFQSKLPDLQQQAGRFFKIGGAGGLFSATSTNVTLGVENHVRFDLEFPATPNGLTLKAAGLKSFGEQNSFGVGVTVLDMVSMKVLGQSTLFANSPVTEFAPVAIPATNSAATSTITNPTAMNPSPVQPAPTPQKPGKASESFWAFVVLAFFGAVLLVLVRRWRDAGGNQ